MNEPILELLWDGALAVQKKLESAPPEVRALFEAGHQELAELVGQKFGPLAAELAQLNLDLAGMARFAKGAQRFTDAAKLGRREGC